MVAGTMPGLPLRPTPAGRGAHLDLGSLRRLSLDLLARPPFSEESEAWIGKPRSEWLEWGLATDDFWQNWFEEQLYYFLLLDSFRPTSQAVQDVPALLAKGRLGVLEALHRICLSSSFDRRNPGPDTFVSVVMEQLLGITVQNNARELEMGKRLYDGKRGTFLGCSGDTQSDVIVIAMRDARVARHLLQREHVRWLRQEPSATALNAWAQVLERDPTAFPSIVRDWFLSEEYDRRLTTRSNQPNRLFVRSLFVDLLGRLPNESETQKMRTALDGLADSGPLRALLARLILDSNEVPLEERASLEDPAAWIRGTFERLLGRTPHDAELDVFVASLSDPACRTATVVYAIVSHPEYQTW
jgi:hypothetical protein